MSTVFRTMPVKIVLCLLLVFFSTNVNGYCLAEDSNPYKLFSTITAYEAGRGTAGSDSKCEPVKIWSLNRHGARYPSAEDIQEMKKGIELQKQIIDNYVQNIPPDNNKLCDKDLKALADWKWNASIENFANFLTVKGWNELRGIAQRYQRRYPELMSNYSDDQLYFRHTVEQRTWASCHAFIEGLFGSDENVPIDKPRDNDKKIRPYKHCEAWKLAVNKTFTDVQPSIFRKEEDYVRLLNNITERLGFKKPLNYTNIDAMYNLCRFEFASSPNNTISPWCSVFRKYELFLMEYLYDMVHYYKSGYGHEFNLKLGCMPLKALMKTFKHSVESGSVKTKGIFLFTHDTMLNMFMTALGYDKDEKKLLGFDYKDPLVSRLFRTSISTTFAANIVAVLHKCKENDYEVQFFLNERPMEIEGCTKGLCSWNYLSDKYSFADSCNLDFCKLP